METPPDKPNLPTRSDAVTELWSLGELSWKLHHSQLDMYKAFHASKGLKFIINSARRLGKSFFLLTLACEEAIKRRRSRICYASATAKSVRTIITPLMNEILVDCPEWLRPVWRSQEQKYIFPNGSEIQIAGTDAERAEALRGGAMHLGLCDEAAFMQDLEYIVSDIMMPMALSTDGRMILASTPPRSPSHYFTIYAQEAETSGNYIKKTIYDNPLYPEERIVRFMLEACRNKITEAQAWEHVRNRTSPKSTTWRREYMAEFIKDEDSGIIPEFDEQMALDLVQEVKRPHFFDAYVGMDVGFNDFTAVLFGYYDFIEAKLVIEDEIVIEKMTTMGLANDIRRVEKELWGGKVPYARWSDVDKIVINDLSKEHGIFFNATAKDNRESAINKVRMLVAQKRIIIHPRCKNLVAHLKYGIWNKARTQFERSAEHGHYDCVAALIYMVRNVSENKNPIPPGYGTNIQEQFIPANMTADPVGLSIGKLFDSTKLFRK